MLLLSQEELLHGGVFEEELRPFFRMTPGNLYQINEGPQETLTQGSKQRVGVLGVICKTDRVLVSSSDPLPERILLLLSGVLLLLSDDVFLRYQPVHF